MINAKIRTYEESQMLLIRVVLGLNPIHDPVEAVRVLYEEGREAFERLRGEPCSHVADWRPNGDGYGDDVSRPGAT